MTDRYYSESYDELYYIFDSHTITEKEFKEKLEYDDYDAFENSLNSDEILELLNQLAEMKEVGLMNISCLNCDFIGDNKDGERYCKECKDNEMYSVLICDEWRKQK